LCYTEDSIISVVDGTFPANELRPSSCSRNVSVSNNGPVKTQRNSNRLYMHPNQGITYIQSRICLYVFYTCRLIHLLIDVRYHRPARLRMGDHRNRGKTDPWPGAT